MAHPDTEVSEAVDVSALDDAAAIDAFDTILADEEQEEVGDDEPEADEAEGEESEEEQDGEEPEEPAIPAPVSFNKEEQAVFASMTPEQQRTVAAIEVRRNADVQKATTEAAEAKRNAKAEAEGQLAQIQRQYATELEQYAKAFEPQMPDPALAQANPNEYLQQLAVYNAGLAHAENLRKRAADASANATALEKQQLAQWEREQNTILAREIPEWNDPAKRSELVDKLVSVGRSLGFTDEALSNVDATELLALRQIATDRDKAAKYDELMGQKMAAVRAAKGKPSPITVKPGAAQPKGSGQRRALADATARLKQTGSDADALAAFEAMGL